jgi:hypothetical protein
LQQKYAAKIKEYVNGLIVSLIAIVEYLEKFLDSRKVKEEMKVQKPDPEIKGVLDTSGIGTKSGSERHLGQTPIGSTSSASTHQTFSQAFPKDARQTSTCPMILSLRKFLWLPLK